MISKPLVDIGTLFVFLLSFSVAQAGIDIPGWYDDVSDGRLPGMLDVVTFGTLESDFGDMDGDGHVDIVMANDGAEPVVVLFNDGNANFHTYRLIDVPGRVLADIDLGDVDGDGDLDMVVGVADYNGAQTRILMNNGDRTFSDDTSSRLPISVANTRDVDFVDVDNDGDLDIIEANVAILLTNSMRQNRIYINNGTGYFVDESLNEDGTAKRFPVDKASTRSIHAADVDGDGDLDLICANRFDSPLWGSGYDGPQNRLWMNDGNGYFTYEEARLPIDEMSSRDVISGDVDNDGDLDLVFGDAIGDSNDPAGGGQQNMIYMNDGNGFFTDETLNPDGTAYRLSVLVELTKSVDLVDIDNDGDLDLVEANSRGENGFLAPQPGQQNRIHMNDGNGFFTDESLSGEAKRWRIPYRIDNTYDIDLADVDGDGDLDIFAAEREEKNRLLINRTPREMYELYWP